MRDLHSICHRLLASSRSFFFYMRQVDFPAKLCKVDPTSNKQLTRFVGQTSCQPDVARGWQARKCPRRENTAYTATFQFDVVCSPAFDDASNVTQPFGLIAGIFHMLNKQLQS